MRVWGVKLKYIIYMIIGIWTIATPLGMFIVITTYMAMKEDAEKIEREQQQKTLQNVLQNVRFEVVNGEEYEEADPIYPDADEEFNKKKFRRNLRRWR